MKHLSRDARLVDLDNYQARIKRLEIDEFAGAQQVRMRAPVTGRMLPVSEQRYNLGATFRAYAQQTYGRPRAAVEEEITAAWYPQARTFGVTLD